MSYNPTFPIEFYRKSSFTYHGLAYAVLLFGMFWFLGQLDNEKPLFLEFSINIILGISVLMMIFFIHQLLMDYTKPSLIIARYHLIHRTAFGNKIIRYKTMKTLETRSGTLGRERTLSPEIYFLIITTKDDDIITIPLTTSYYQGTPYNAKEIFHLIQQAFNGEKPTYQGVDMGKSRGLYTL